MNYQDREDIKMIIHQVLDHFSLFQISQLFLNYWFVFLCLIKVGKRNFMSGFIGSYNMFNRLQSRSHCKAFSGACHSDCDKLPLSVQEAAKSISRDGAISVLRTSL